MIDPVSKVVLASSRPKKAYTKSVIISRSRILRIIQNQMMIHTCEMIIAGEIKDSTCVEQMKVV